MSLSVSIVALRRPPSGRKFGTVATSLALAVSLISTFPADGAATHSRTCDELAAAPSDPNRTAPGVAFADLIADSAITACTDAVRESPHDKRLNFQLGRAHDKRGDYSNARKFYEQAGTYPIALLNLAIHYINGQGVKQNYAEAARLLRQSADQRYGPAQVNLAILYQEGNGVEKNFAEAASLFRQAASQGNALAQYHLGVALANGSGVAQSYSEAIKWLRAASDQGLALAQYTLGVLYGNGKGTEENSAEAANLFRAAAAQGIALAQYNYGIALAKGIGVSQNYTEAAKWLRDASGQGLSMAQYNLGILYETGYGVERDKDKANALFLAAAQQGNADAQTKMGEVFSIGPPKSDNRVKAIEYYRKAAQQGHALAQTQLGICFEEGLGVQQNYSEAAKWYQVAAEQGFARAQSRLGALYETGRGVDKNWTAAAELYRKAALQAGGTPSQLRLQFFEMENQGADGALIPLAQKMVAADEKEAGRTSSNISWTLSFLAHAYFLNGRYSDAEPVYRRIVELREEVPDADLVTALLDLGMIREKLGRYDEADSLYTRAISISKTVNNHSYSEIESLKRLGALYNKFGRYAEAEGYFQRCLTLLAQSPAGADSDPSLFLRRAEARVGRRRYDDAEKLIRRAVDIYTAKRDQRRATVGLDYLADILQKSGKNTEALVVARRVVNERIVASGRLSDTQLYGETAEMSGSRNSFVRLMSLLVTEAPTSDPEIVGEAFISAQYAGGLDTARALGGMTARFAAGSDELAALVRSRQEIEARRRVLDGRLADHVSHAPDRPGIDADEVHKEIPQIEKQLAEIDSTLRAKFPRFFDLVSARPASLSDIQTVLGPHEALAVLTVGEQGSFGFVVRNDRAQFYRIRPKAKEIEEVVNDLRDNLDPRGRMLLEMPNFDAQKSHKLYQELFGPAAAMLADAKSLILIPDGALQSLPASVLVLDAPQSPISAYGDYKSVSWLARRYSVSVLPSVSSLTALRRYADFHHARLPFVGFGDPDFRNGAPQATPATWREIKASSLFSSRGASTDALHILPSLPTTKEELLTEAQMLGAPASSVYLGKDATVTKVRSLDLSDVRVVAFATHGLIAGELPTLAEPALAMTPPISSDEHDDGLLRASDVAQLKLNADWVLLSACNTAASDGKPGAEALSGLAKAFFYAGARSLLVSHWSVDSVATTKLTTGAFKALQENPEIGRSEAVRRSMLAMLDNAGSGDVPKYMSHPTFWAPFVAVGEGGPGK